MRLTGGGHGFTPVLELPSNDGSLIMIPVESGVRERIRSNEGDVRERVRDTFHGQSGSEEKLPMAPSETASVKRARKPTLLDVRRIAERAFVSGKMRVLSQEELRAVTKSALDDDDEFTRRLVAKKKEIATLNR
jgi:hypothetical protein